MSEKKGGGEGKGKGEGKGRGKQRGGCADETYSRETQLFSDRLYLRLFRIGR